MESVRKLQAKDYLVLMRTPNLVDARRLYNPSEYGSLNFAAGGFRARSKRFQHGNSILRTLFSREVERREQTGRDTALVWKRSACGQWGE